MKSGRLVSNGPQVHEHAPDSSQLPGQPDRVCSRCGRPLDGYGYAVQPGERLRERCLRCTLMHPLLVRRCAAIALVVGTLLTLINHFGVITSGEFPASLAWKIPLNYLVPYSVATVSAVLNSRQTVRDRS